jgi:hypothetical protein
MHRRRLTETGENPVAGRKGFVQATTAGTPWVPIALSDVKFQTQNLTGIGVAMPTYINVAGMAYPNFSSLAGDGSDCDLVVIIQAGDYANCALIFIAVPHSNNPLLSGAAALSVKRR